MTRQFHNKRCYWRSLTNKPVWTNYWTDQTNFTGHMFNTKLEEKSNKITFKALPVKIQQSKNRQGRRNVPPPPSPGGVRVKSYHHFLVENDAIAWSTMHLHSLRQGVHVPLQAWTSLHNNYRTQHLLLFILILRVLLRYFKRRNKKKC